MDVTSSVRYSCCVVIRPVCLGFVPIQTYKINPLTPELNPSAQRCLTRFYARYFDS
jgi:hypothetical protein